MILERCTGKRRDRLYARLTDMESDMGSMRKDRSIAAAEWCAEARARKAARAERVALDRIAARGERMARYSRHVAQRREWLAVDPDTLRLVGALLVAVVGLVAGAGFVS